MEQLTRSLMFTGPLIALIQAPAEILPVRSLRVSGPRTTVWRHCDCIANLAPHINRQTYLPTCTIIMSSSFRLVYWIGLDLIGPSSRVLKHLCIFGLMVLCKCSLKIILTSLYLLEGLAWWDWPFTWCTDQMLSFSAWHCWLGHLTRKNLPQYDYNVFGGTLNPTLLLLQLYLKPAVSISSPHLFSRCSLISLCFCGLVVSTVMEYHVWGY